MVAQAVSPGGFACASQEAVANYTWLYFETVYLVASGRRPPRPIPFSRSSRIGINPRFRIILYSKILEDQDLEVCDMLCPTREPMEILAAGLLSSQPEYRRGLEVLHVG
jgi:hypothetical protein